MVWDIYFVFGYLDLEGCGVEAQQPCVVCCLGGHSRIVAL